MATDQIVPNDAASDEIPVRQDGALLAAIADSRDMDAFSELFERYKQRAYNLTFNLTQNRALAEDAVQDAMLALWQSPKITDSTQDVQSWILGIIAHKSLTLLRTRARSEKREERKRATERS